MNIQTYSPPNHVSSWAAGSLISVGNAWCRSRDIIQACPDKILLSECTNA